MLTTPSAKTLQGLHVLALNSGSSSLKFGLYRLDDQSLQCLASGEAQAIGEDEARFSAVDASGQRSDSASVPLSTQREAVLQIGDFLLARQLPAPQAIGHRVVHGGPLLRVHCRLDAEVLKTLEEAAPFAPLHTPAALEVMRYASDHFPGVPQVACFDTSFHAQMPPVASTLPLPFELRAQGIQRYGFHGLSCESIVQQLAKPLPARLIIAHLGNGASITAVLHGVSIDTSMGLTPTGGIVMGTRTGDLDPGVLVYLMREKHFDAAAIEAIVDHQSGLLGVSGLSGDLRTLHAKSASHPDALLAIDLFCYSAAKQIAAMTAALGGVDALVFTGGIGEHDVAVRVLITQRLACVGVELDATANCSAGAIRVSAPSSRCEVHVLPSQEDEQIARHVYALQGAAVPIG